jgi:predicted CXXCH cytochrome family protein
MRISRVLLSLAALTGAAAFLALVHAQEEEAPATFVKNAMCLACHKATNPDMIARFQETKHAKVELKDEMKPLDLYRRTVGFDPADNTYYEKGVGCQSCHGAGSLHLKAQGEEAKRATMKRVDKLDTPKKKLSVCGRCHGAYHIGEATFAAGFKPGADLWAIEGFKLDEITEPGPFQQLNELESSRHGAQDVTCITCHTSHESTEAKPQLRKPVPELCLQCHSEAHKCTVAADKIPEGATCATCHMPGGRHLFAVQK